MKRLTYSLAAKTAAVILSFVFAVLTAGCVLAGAFMYSERFYTKTSKQIEEDKYSAILYKSAYRIAEYYGEGNTEASNRLTDIYFTVTDIETGETLINTYENQKYIGKAVFKNMSVHRTVESPDEIYIEEYLGNVDITVYAAENYPLSYSNLLYLKLTDFLYPLRYSIIFIGLLALLLFVLTMVFIYAAAGRQADGSIKLSFFDKIPFDLLTVCIIVIGMLNIEIVENIYAGAEFQLIALSAMLSFDYFIALLYTVSFAVRIKAGTFLKNNVIYKLLCILWRGLKKVFGFLGVILKNLSLVKKTVLICAAVLGFDLLVTVICLSAWALDFFLVLAVLNAVAIAVLIIFTAVQLQRIKNGGEKIAEGDIDYKIDTSYMFPEFREFCGSLNNISAGMQNAVDEKMKSERMRTELITNVSHDIKTPLTSIINYVDLIKKEQPEDEKIKEYVAVLDRQSSRLKKLIEDLVEASKASSGSLKVELSECDAGVLLSQTVGEFDERLKKAELTPVLTVPDTSVKIMADGRHLWRVLENLTGNMCKYSLPGTRVYMDLTVRNGKAVITFKNISKYPLNISGDELMERFVRGDTSRNTEGSGLGLSIARSLTELQGGDMKIDIDGDLFKATLKFDLINDLEISGTA